MKQLYDEILVNGEENANYIHIPIGIWIELEIFEAYM